MPSHYELVLPMNPLNNNYSEFMGTEWVSNLNSSIHESLAVDEVINNDLEELLDSAGLAISYIGCLYLPTNTTKIITKNIPENAVKIIWPYSVSTATFKIYSINDPQGKEIMQQFTDATGKSILYFSYQPTDVTEIESFSLSAPMLIDYSNPNSIITAESGLSTIEGFLVRKTDFQQVSFTEAVAALQEYIVS